jgi:hypothetical protein
MSCSGVVNAYGFRVIAMVVVVSFARLVVVTNQALSMSSIIQAVSEHVP